MSAPKSYTQTELNKMSKKKMRHILQEDYGKTAEEVKLGHLCKPYRELISKCQGSTDAKSQAANAKPKIKFVAPPINDQFERAKAKVAKAAERKDEIEDENETNHNNHNASDSLGRFDEHDRSLEAVDALSDFAASVNKWAGKSIFTDEYLIALDVEEVELEPFQAMLVNWNDKGVLTLTNKDGDFKMKHGHVAKMYQFMVNEQSSIAGSFGGSGGGGGKMGTGSGGFKVNDVGGKGNAKIPFLGDNERSPDYKGMIAYIYDERLKVMSVDHLLKGKTYYNTRGLYWLIVMIMIRGYLFKREKDPKKKILPTHLTDMQTGKLGLVKYIAIGILNSPGEMEKIFKKNRKAIAGEQLKNDIRNFLGAIYEKNEADLGAVQYAFDERFVMDFQLMWGGDIWAAVKEWCETSAVYSEYKKQKQNDI